jgi:hypothetical protein
MVPPLADQVTDELLPAWTVAVHWAVPLGAIVAGLHHQWNSPSAVGCRPRTLGAGSKATTPGKQRGQNISTSCSSFRTAGCSMASAILLEESASADLHIYGIIRRQRRDVRAHCGPGRHFSEHAIANFLGGFIAP